MPAERGLPTAYHRALEAGMGVVVPVRDHDGRLVISDRPADTDSLSLESFLVERPVWPGSPPFLAIRVCAEGLARMLHRCLVSIEGVQPVLVGISVPDMAEYIDGHLPIFVRQSEHEPEPAYYEYAEGVWLESFERDWFDDRLLVAHLKTGKLVTVVSPEIHGREHMPMWELLAVLQSRLGELAGSIQLCTSIPQMAREYFCTS